MHKLKALDVIKQLQASDTIPIERARMRVRITMPNKDGKKLKEKVTPLVDTVEDEDWSDEWELVRADWLVGGLQKNVC